MPAVGERRYPSSRAVRRARRPVDYDDTTTIAPTWIQVNSFYPEFKALNDTNAASPGVFHGGQLNNSFGGAYVDWAAMTRTWRRPRNPAGGIRRFVHDLGLAKVQWFAADIATQELYEDRQMLLVPPNTYTEARKLAPDSSAQQYFNVDVIGYTSFGSYRAHRWFGGSNDSLGNGNSIDFFVYAGGDVADFNIWIAWIDPGTLITDVYSFVLVQTITDSGGGNSFNISHDQLEAAGLVPFDQFWIYVESAYSVPDPDTWTVDYQINLPDNIPPVYNCAGAFDNAYAPGGFIP